MGDPHRLSFRPDDAGDDPSSRLSHQLPSSPDAPFRPQRKFSDVMAQSSSGPGRRKSNQRASVKLSVEDRVILLNELGLNTVTYSPRKSPRRPPIPASASILTGQAGSALGASGSSASQEFNLTPMMASREGSVTSNVHSMTRSFKSIKLHHPDEIEDWFQTHPSRRNSRQLATIWEADEECASPTGNRSPDRPGSLRRKTGF
jgi:hypothetical protein